MYVQYAHTRPSHACSSSSQRLVQAWAPCLVSPGERTHQSARAVCSLSSSLSHIHTHKYMYFLSFSLLVVRPLDIRRCPGHVIPLCLPSRIWHRFSWEEEDGKGGGRKKAEKDGARIFGEVRLPQTRGILRLCFPSSSRSLLSPSLPPPLARISFSFFHFLPRLPSGCSYVHVS